MPHPRLAFALTTVLIGPIAAVALTPTAASAAQTIGYPTFSGSAIPAPPVAMTTGSTMQAMYDAEKGGTDFWMDRLLARSGNDPAGTWLMSRGRAVFMKTHTPSVLGFGGTVAYWESINDQPAFTVTAGSGTWTEQVAQRWQAPSYWKSVHTNGTLRITQTKFITQNDVAVDNLAITNTGSGSVTVPLRVTSPYATSGSGSAPARTRITACSRRSSAGWSAASRRNASSPRSTRPTAIPPAACCAGGCSSRTPNRRRTGAAWRVFF